MEQIIYWCLIALGGLIAFTIVIFLIPFVMSIPAMSSLPKPPDDRVSMDGVITIGDAVEKCSSTGLTGLELVEYAQRMVARKMRYSFRNPYDSPARAFERGLGYCWHKGWALYMILDRLVVDARLVHAFKVKFPSAYVEGVWFEGGVLGHMWVRVTVGGTEYDVDPEREENRPGMIYCPPISPVIPLTPFISALSYFGSPYINSVKYFSWRKANMKKDDRQR